MAQGLKYPLLQGALVSTQVYQIMPYSYASGTEPNVIIYFHTLVTNFKSTLYSCFSQQLIGLIIYPSLGDPFFLLFLLLFHPHRTIGILLSITCVPISGLQP